VAGLGSHYERNKLKREHGPAMVASKISKNGKSPTGT